MFALVNDTAIFQTMNFRKRPDLQIVSAAITLNAKTTLKDVQRLYPKAVSRIETVLVEKGHVQMVSLGAFKEYADEWWILMFDGDKLIEVQMYSPC